MENLSENTYINYEILILFLILYLILYLFRNNHNIPYSRLNSDKSDSPAISSTKEAMMMCMFLTLFIAFLRMTEQSNDRRLSGSSGLPIFAEYIGQPVRAIDLSPDATVDDVLIAFKAASEGHVPDDLKVSYRGSIIEDRSTTLADAEIGQEATVQIVRGEIGALFELLPREGDRQRLLGFPNYAAMHQELPLSEDKKQHLTNIAMGERTGQLVTFHESSSLVERIHWTDHQIQGSPGMNINWHGFIHFRSLQYLSLRDNGLNGPVIGTFDFSVFPSSLEFLDLSRNELTGSLDLSTLPESLEYASLDGNKFSGRVDGSMLPPNLKGVSLRNNELSGIVDFSSFRWPQGLKWIFFQGNQFEESDFVKGDAIPENCRIKHNFN